MKLQRAWILLFGVVLMQYVDKPGAAAENDAATELTPGQKMEKGAQPAKTDPAVIAAWKEAGANIFWVGVDEQGLMTQRAKCKTDTNDILAFGFSWSERKLLTFA